MDCDTLCEVIEKLKGLKITRKARMELKSARARERARGFNEGIRAALRVLVGETDDEE